MNKDYSRIKLNYNEVKEVIQTGKTYNELSKHFGCGKEKIRCFLVDNDLYEEYCKIRNMPVKLTKHKCEVCNNNIRVKHLHGHYYCHRHYNQMYRYGRILEKTIYDANDIEIDGDIIRIILRDRFQKPKAIAIIDTEDYPKVKPYKWYASDKYCITKGINPESGVDISNVIFNDFENKFDHINHNRMDNRKINLRPVTSHQNAMNMGKKCTNTSGVTGVQAQKELGILTGRWTAIVTYKYKAIWLGSYATFDEAVIARLRGEAKYFQEYAPTYNAETELLELTYFSQTDKLTHQVHMNLDGEIILNEIIEGDTNDNL